MKTYLKYSIMLTLALMMTIGLVKAQPQPIGTTLQLNPWESNPLTPTDNTLFGVTSNTLMRDGRITTEGFFQIADNDDLDDTWVEFTGFDAPAATFTITWVDLNINFAVDPGLIDDTWRIEWTVGAQPMTVLIADNSNQFDPNAGAGQTCAWSQLVEPNDGAWDWTDISTLTVRFVTTAGADGFSDFGLMHIKEVWATVYSSPVPSAGMSIQPPNINALAASRRFFIDIYTEDVIGLAGYQLRVYFDTTYLNPLAGGWSYYPYTEASAPDDLNDALGYVEISYTIPIADPLAGTGVSGNFPIARIYFITVTGIPADWHTWFRFTVSFMGDAQAVKLPHKVIHGSYGTLPAESYLMGSDPIPVPIVYPYEEPISTNWIEQFPDYGNRWHLTSWDDNGDFKLSESDQIDMTQIDPPVPGSPVFHVDQIWECNADPETYVFMLLTIKEIPEFPLGLGLVMATAPAIAIAYLWRTRTKKRVE